MSRPSSPVHRLACSTLAALATLAAAAPIATAATTGVSSAPEWSAFRGARGDGTIAGAGALRDGAVTLEPVWRRPLGSGYSQIVTAGEVGVTMASDGKDDVVVAFDVATGKDRWRHSLGATYKGHDGSDDGPISTPAIAGDAVYALSPFGQLVGLRLADGALLWRRDLAAGGAKTLRAPLYGVSTAPVVAGELLIVPTGGEHGGAVLALRRADGQDAWRWGDDTVSYQNALLAEVAGEAQVVVYTDHLVAGLDPANGAERWSFRHRDGNGELAGQPVALGDGRFLIQGDGQTIALQVTRGADGFAAQELWRTTALQNTYAVPVAAGDTVYGYTGRFLTAVDAATGKPRWKSRPPGGRGLVVVDGHLLAIGEDGELVLAAARTDDYRELARVKALDSDPYTTPTVVRAGSESFVLVRDLGEMAALRVVPRAAAAPTGVAVATAEASGPAPVAEVARLLAELAATPAGERQAKADAFLAAHPRLPLAEPSGKVTFLARAEKDAGVLGSWANGDESGETALAQVPGTKLFHATLELDPQAYYEYQVNVDFGDPGPDPLNPWKIGDGPGGQSQLPMPRYPLAAHVLPDAPAPAAAGKLETFELASKIRGGDAAKRTITVYLPPGYESGGERYPLVVVHNGGPALARAGYPGLMDSLIAAGQVAPAVLAFISRVDYPEYASLAVREYARLVGEELVPELDRRYRLAQEPARRASIGVGTGAVAALWSAYASPPNTFGFAAAQSYFRVGENVDALEQLIATAPKRELRIHVEIAKGDLTSARQNFDGERDSRRLVETLRAAGYETAVENTVGGAGWGRWRSTFHVVLGAFAPGKSAGTARTAASR